MNIITSDAPAMSEGSPIRDDIEGYLYRPAGQQVPGAALILLHERYGVVEHSRNLAKRFSEAGYTVILPDLFMGSDLDREALREGTIHGRVADARAAEIIDLCIDHLKADPLVDPGRIGIMGVCMTGRYAIVVNSRRKDLACSVIFYGAASRSNWEINEGQPESIEAMVERIEVPTLLVFAEKDHTMSIEHLGRLRAAFENARKSYRMRIYPEVPHGFLNETMPGRYRPAEAEEALATLMSFLEEAFGGKWPADKVHWDFQSTLSPDYDFTKNVRMA